MFWKVASLESGESGKLSLESDSLESCGREKTWTILAKLPVTFNLKVKNLIIKTINGDF